MITKLRMSGKQYDQLRKHLLPIDGKEAVALALCGERAGSETHCLTVRKVILIPHDECTVRDWDRITWLTTRLHEALEEAMKFNLSLLKIHSHPKGYPQFSDTDDFSDKDLFSCVYGWLAPPLVHASAIMLGDGRIIGRSVGPDGEFAPISLVSVAGDDLHFWYADETPTQIFEFARRHTQLFGQGTTDRLQKLSIGVVGCSGTGSVVVEQLARLGVGRLVLVDPDIVEEKNLNRIVNATREDARQGTLKVRVQERAIAAMDLGTKVLALPENICTPQAIRAIAECDVVFGCMDGAEGRHILNRLAAFYQLPYFDVGVRLEADGDGGISQVCGSVNYLQPEGSSLLSRKLITIDDVNAQAMKRTNPAEYTKRLKEKYISGVVVDRPAVVSVNTHYASLAVGEFLARLHPFRDDDNASFARIGSSLTQTRFFSDPDGESCPLLARCVGRGDVKPLLDMSILSEA